MKKFCTIHKPAHLTPRSSGFTLIEVLTVVVVITILLLAVAPRVAKLMEDARQERALNATISMASAAKAMAMRNITFDPAPASYSGAAVLFTPANELRLVENIPTYAADSGEILETDSKWAPVYLSGFADLPSMEYVRFSDDVLLFGLSNPAPLGSNGRMITAPFAIMISNQGQLVSDGSINGDSMNAASPDETSLRRARRQVFYDTDGNTTIDVGSTRSNGYDPDAWHPAHTTQPMSTIFDEDLARYVWPFERIETVRGLYIVDRRDFDEARLLDPTISPVAVTGSGGVSESTRRWVAENGVLILFNHSLEASVKRP